MKTLIKGAKIVLYDRVLDGENLLIEDGIIAKITNDTPDADEVIALSGEWLVPGFVDLHCHGGDGYDLMDGGDASQRIAEYHLAHGTTSLSLTTLADRDEALSSALDAVATLMDSGELQNVVGVHLEGPWLAPSQAGAQKPESMHAPIEGELEELKMRYPFITRISAAPELDPEGIFAAEALSLGILPAIAHTDATFSDVEAAISHGYRLMTHLYSGMKGVERKNSFRIAGAVEAGLYFDDLFVEVIADGKHLPYELLRYIYKLKGSDRICLVTDAIRAAGLPDGSRTKIGSMKDGLDVVVEDGVAKLVGAESFAGSTAAFDRIYRTMREATGCDMVSLSRMASTTPAGLLGLSDRGEIKVGLRADLVVLTTDLKIKNVFLGGNKI